METHTHILFNFSKKIILRLENEADAREQDVHSLREELEQTRADHERCVKHLSLHNYFVVFDF